MKYVLVFFMIWSCTKGPTTPEGLLQMYVVDITTKGLDKNYYEKYTGGKLWDSILNLSEEEFAQLKPLTKVKNPKISISNKNCPTELECTLTYIVKYDYNGLDESKYKSEVKKVAIMKQIDGEWKIFDVSNIKTYLNSKTPLEVLEVNK